MNPSDAIEAIEKPLSSLPYSLSRHILEHLRKLTSHEPVPGIMGKSGAGKSSLCNALFQGEITPVSDVHAGTREVQRFRLNGHGHSMVILRARRATGLMTRDNYRTVNNITLGKYPEAK
ncbi:GTPase [Escherichia coli]|uniref:GTPase n=1 Tax=Escherichia coli TaxID=562 RepID=UPI001CEC38A4|nr:GTPase [Escherichia coli]